MTHSARPAPPVIRQGHVCDKCGLPCEAYLQGRKQTAVMISLCCNAPAIKAKR